MPADSLGINSNDRFTDIWRVSIWLGHADIKTTKMYLRASPADKLEVLEANTPHSIQRGLPGINAEQINGNSAWVSRLPRPIWHYILLGIKRVAA